MGQKQKEKKPDDNLDEEAPAWLRAQALPTSEPTSLCMGWEPTLTLLGQAPAPLPRTSHPYGLPILPTLQLGSAQSREPSPQPRQTLALAQPPSTFTCCLGCWLTASS